MGRRGGNREGYYLVLLYALDLQYRLQSRGGEQGPLHWQPSPRRRPDQFMRWVVESLETLKAPAPRSFGGLLVHLGELELEHVAVVLEATVRRAWGRQEATNGLEGLPVGEVLAAIAQPNGAREAHPQARKVAQSLSGQLDGAWLWALDAAGKNEADPCCVLLGGLAPGFEVIERYLGGISWDDELLPDYGELTVLQCYGLTTGVPPEPAPAWRPAVEELRHLNMDDLALLRSLSPTELRALQHPGVELLDAERLIPLRRLGLGPQLLERLRHWDDAIWAKAKRLLTDYWKAIDALLEEGRALEEVVKLQPVARLDLRDVFPQTVAWLDGVYLQHYDEIHFRPVEEVADEAKAFSRRVLEELFAHASDDLAMGQHERNQRADRNR
ncbi:MAG TPA: hypothetical protein VF171_09410 [Trueperaceae bacterium]